MKINAAPRILIVAGVCIAALVGLVISEGAARAGGQEVRLPMEAVDPRALLSGHYVVVDLRQRLAPGQQCPTGEGDWIALRPEGDHHTVAGAAPSRERAQQVGPLPVKGGFSCSEPVEDADGEMVRPAFVALDLDIHRFHINQTDAERIERVLREQRPDDATRAFAIVSVGRDGRARLKGVEIDGERLELSWL
ncbi:MAG: GDYXXLXY domain-containing protein [Hyphomonadaceae bacterium]